jgi:hypothetical protein
MKKILATSILLTVFVTLMSGCCHGHKKADAAAGTPAAAAHDCGCDDKMKAACGGGCAVDAKKDTKEIACADCKDHKTEDKKATKKK